MTRRAAIAAVLVAASGVHAGNLRPVPDYFAEAIFASNMAVSLAELCPSVKVNPDQVQARRAELLDRLTADGFNGEDAMAQMQDPTGQVHSLQSAFLEKYPLETATRAQACTAALSEIGNGTLLGSLLTEVDL